MTVRIEKIKPFEVDYEIKTDTIWFENHNIEECIKTTVSLGIEHIHLQTTTLDFLNDHRLRSVRGVTIQFEIPNIEPLYNLNKLTHLNLPGNIKIEFDFSKFKGLVFLGGSFPKKYINITQLLNLKFTYIFNYRKLDFSEFASCKDLRRLWFYSADIENLNGLSNLENLIQIDLENCRKLTSLDGIGGRNINLQTLHLVNCKKLMKADALTKLPNLRQLQFFQVYELESLAFLKSLNKLQNLMLHPSKVGVKNEDYYPLIGTLKKLNKLDNLRGWKPLNDYLQNKIVIEAKPNKQKSDFELIKENLGIMNWTEKREYGLEQYSEKNCQAAEALILDLIKLLGNLDRGDISSKEGLIKQCVLKLNKFNDSLGGSFIETGEREELCDLFDNIADAAGLNVHAYQGGIADKWREW